MSGVKSARDHVLVDIVGSIPSWTIRRLVYERLGMTLDRSSVIHRRAELRSPNNITIGHHVIVGHDAILDGRAGITIEDNVNLSSEVAIWTMQHDPNDIDFGVREAPVTVQDHAWISFRAVILPGVTVGRGAVVAAGAIVTTDVEPFTIVGGIPARKIGTRRQHLRYTLQPAHKFM